MKAYGAALASRSFCLTTSNADRCTVPTAPTPPADLTIKNNRDFIIGTTAPGPGSAPVAVLTPEQVAYIALAELRLDPPKPAVGPPPSINPWKMAAVGYPLWLWGEGDTDPAPVSSTVGTLTVSLSAKITQMTFTMGDGHAITCPGAGTVWRRGDVKPSQKSPTCGYAYQQPSLPKGNYTITARTDWAVTWTVNGQTGIIPFSQSASTELPVGELQVLVR